MSRYRGSVGPAGMGGLTALRGASSLIRSVQRGTLTFGTADVTQTATVEAVDLKNCILRNTGCGSNGSTVGSSLFVGLSVAGTTVTGTRSAHGGIAAQCAWELVEYAPGVIKSVQRGTKAINGTGGTYTQTITEVDPAKSSLESLGFTGDGNGLSGSFLSPGTMTNGTTLTYTTYQTAGGLTYTAYYQVVEWF